MQVVALVLAVAGLVLGAVTSLGANALEAAERFTDGHAYQALVLDHRGEPFVPPGHWVTTTSGVVWGVVSVVGSFLVAAALLYRSRAADAAIARAVAPLRAAHSGHVGDYVAWLTVGVAFIGGLLAVTLR